MHYGSSSAHNSKWQIAEVVFGFPFILAIVLQFIFPWALPGETVWYAFAIVGLALVIIGVGFIFLARLEFARFRQPTDPGHPTTRIVASGVFSISRNPIYLGAACFLAGVGLMFNLPWVLALLLPSIVLCHFILIVPEERYLENKFGEEYHEYASTVHRWIGRAH